MKQKIFDSYDNQENKDDEIELEEETGLIDGNLFYNVEQGFGAFSSSLIGTTQVKTCLGVAIFCEIMNSKNEHTYGTYVYHFDGVEDFFGIDFGKRELMIPNAIIFSGKILNFFKEELILNKCKLLQILNVAMLGGAEEVTLNIVEGFKILQSDDVSNPYAIVNLYEIISQKLKNLNIESSSTNLEVLESEDSLKNVNEHLNIFINNFFKNDTENKKTYISNITKIFTNSKFEYNLVSDFIKKTDIFLAPVNGKIINDDVLGETRIVSKIEKDKRTLFFEFFFHRQAHSILYYRFN